MKDIKGYVCMKQNGDLDYIFKSKISEDDLINHNSIKMYWEYSHEDIADSWDILIEAIAVEANEKEIKMLSNAWGLDDKEAQTYAKLRKIKLFKDGNQWCATKSNFKDLQSSPSGFGDTCLDAIGELCKNLGFKVSKSKGRVRFVDLLKDKNL